MATKTAETFTERANRRNLIYGLMLPGPVRDFLRDIAEAIDDLRKKHV